MENQKESSDCEDIPSDFFDDFNKDEFIEGLSIIDSWNGEEKKTRSSRARINAKVIDSVRDLRELIDRESHEKKVSEKYDSRKKLKRKKGSEERDDSLSRLDEYIKPGSRRDPNKTNEAIKRDKQEKVKEYLAKHLESSEDLRPPGTELDDFLEEKRIVEAKKNKLVATIDANISPPNKHESLLVKHHGESPKQRRESPVRHRELSGKRRESPGRRHESPGRRHESPGRRHESPGRRQESSGKRRESPGRRRESPRRRRESPGRRRDSPGRRRESPDRRPGKYRPSSPKYRHVVWRRPVYSPKHSPGFESHRIVRQFSPQRSLRRNHRFSPHRMSPELRVRRSRSPYKRIQKRSRSRSNHRSEKSERMRSRSGSPRKTSKDDFLYPKEYLLPSTDYSPKTEMLYQVAPAPPYAEPMPVEYGISGYSYVPPVHGPAYSGYGAPYDYSGQSASVPAPQPVPAPINTTTPDIPLVPIQAPSMVPAPSDTTPLMNSGVNTSKLPVMPQKAPADALAKLVADGKLSHEDYLKLTPNKGVNQSTDTHARIAVLNRCQTAISKLCSQALTNRLLINNQGIGPEQKQIVPKFCSPLKRQVASEFYFTKFNPSVLARQNKQIVEFIVTALGIQDVVGRPKKVQKDTKEIGVQTMKPYCEVCDIREATKSREFGTMVERQLLTTSVHTQVVEEDLYNSKAVFTPSGGEGANVSIAHMTPAQLVSQLAARAKTLKQSEPPRPRYDPRYEPYHDPYNDPYRYNYRY